jgi:TolA-binding protein
MTSEGVATGADDLKQKLAQQIDAARSKLETLKKDIVSLHEEDMEALRKKREDLRARIDRQKHRLQQMQDDIASWKAEKIAHTQDAITAWRQRRELDKLERRAGRAEDYALRMVSLAAMDFEEAEQAILDAMAARYDAEMAASSGGA